MSKHLTLSGLQTVLPPIKHLIDKKAENVDWNENDPNAKGYVKNRPFYSYDKVIKGEYFLEETTFTGEQDGDNLYVYPFPESSLNFELLERLFSSTSDIESMEFIVSYDNEDYKTKCVFPLNDMSLPPTLGNLSIFDAGEDTGEPFVFGFMGYVGVTTPGEHTISGKVADSVIKEYVKIDEKFLPEYQGGQIGMAGEAEGAEIFNDYENNTAFANYSHAEGRNTQASGSHSHAEGRWTIARGIGSHSEGNNTVAEGRYSHVEGSYSRALGEASHSEGSWTDAVGNSSHSEGYGARLHLYGITGTAGSLIYTLHSNYDTYNFTGYVLLSSDKTRYATILSSTYKGLSGAEYLHEVTVDKTLSPNNNYDRDAVYLIASGALGDFSHNEGKNTIATSLSQHVQGQNNAIDSQEEYLHIVGNGESENSRSNAHTLDWSGNAWYQGDVYVGGSGQDDAAAEKLVKKSELDEAIANIVQEVLEALPDASEVRY